MTKENQGNPSNPNITQQNKINNSQSEQSSSSLRSDNNDVIDGGMRPSTAIGRARVEAVSSQGVENQSPGL